MTALGTFLRALAAKPRHPPIPGHPEDMAAAVVAAADGTVAVIIGVWPRIVYGVGVWVRVCGWVWVYAGWLW